MTKQASPAGISEKVIRLLEIYALIAQKQLLIPFSLCLFPEKGYDPDGVMKKAKQTYTSVHHQGVIIDIIEEKIDLFEIT